MDNEKIVSETASRVLEAAKHDWIQLVEVQGYLLDVAEESGIELWNPSQIGERNGREGTDPFFEKRFALGMRVVEELLGTGRIVPGEIPDGFVPWSGSMRDWLSRIESGWRALGASLNLNDVCWFALRG